MRQEFINWLRQTPNKVVDNFGDINNCPLAQFGKSLGYDKATGGTVSFQQYGARFEVLGNSECQVLCHADAYHQTYGEVADILEARA